MLMREIKFTEDEVDRFLNALQICMLSADVAREEGNLDSNEYWTFINMIQEMKAKFD